jgi:serine phosphatase RsbU (regulator of sigma subunit)
MHVSVSPVHDEAGRVVGGVEMFRGLDGEFEDLRRARRIQTLAIQQKLPRDDRVQFAARYVPHDIVGGDYYAVARLDADRFGFMLGDVTGHGASAALYTVHLGSLWASHRHLIGTPGQFAQAMGNDLVELSGDEAFVTAICGVIDLSKGVVRIASAGGPCPVVLRQGVCESLDARGLPLGLAADVDYEEVEHPLRPGDCLLMFSDGAVEINNAAGHPLDTDGLTRILWEKGYPETAGLKDIEEALLLYSDRVRFGDDLTLLEARIGA